jgi:hypothetical protein
VKLLGVIPEDATPDPSEVMRRRQIYFCMVKDVACVGPLPHAHLPHTPIPTLTRQRPCPASCRARENVCVCGGDGGCMCGAGVVRRL